MSQFSLVQDRAWGLTLVLVAVFPVFDDVVVVAGVARPLHLVLHRRQNGLGLTTSRLFAGALLISTTFLEVEQKELSKTRTWVRIPPIL